MSTEYEFAYSMYYGNLDTYILQQTIQNGIDADAANWPPETAPTLESVTVDWNQSPPQCIVTFSAELDATQEGLLVTYNDTYIATIKVSGSIYWSPALGKLIFDVEDTSIQPTPFQISYTV